MTPLAIKETIFAAKTRADRSAVVAHLASTLGLSTSTVLSRARRAGLRANNKVRADSGSSELTAHHVKIVAGALARTQRLNGQVVAPIKGIVEMLQANGELPALAASTVCRALRQAALAKKQIKAKPTYKTRFADPGQVFLLDSSTSLQWYFPEPSASSAKSAASSSVSSVPSVANPLRPIPPGVAMRLYKPEVAASLKKQIKRYFVSDHGSGYTAGAYVYSPGETELDAVSAVLIACRTMGVPRFFYIDKGPGNTSFGLKYLLWLLDVEPIWKGHEAHVLGRIDSVHNAVQQGLEWRYSFPPRPESVDQMNELLGAWFHKRNCVDLHRDAKRTRHEMFLDAQATTLRRLPDNFNVHAAMLSRPVTRQIDGRGILRFAGKLFRLPDTPEIWNSSQFVSINPFNPATLLVLKNFHADSLQCDARYEATEERLNAFGQIESAAPLIHDHPIGAKKPAWTGELAEAKRIAAAYIKDHDIDVYADLRASSSASIPLHQRSSAVSSPSFSSAQLAAKLAASTPIDASAAQPVYAPETAKIAVLQLLKKRLGRGFTDPEAAALCDWNSRSEIPASDIEQFVANSEALERGDTALEKTG